MKSVTSISPDLKLQSTTLKEAKHPLFFTIVSLSLVLSFLFILFTDASSFVVLTDEDGWVESMGALFFLLAAILFFILYKRDKSGNDLILFKTKKNIFFLLLGLLFTLCCLEEISWGQRIFGIATPEVLQEVNMQQEINLHNLSIFYPGNESGDKSWINLDLIFQLFWFSFCFLVPLLYVLVTPIKNLLDKINLPIVPIYFGLFLIANFCIIKLIGYNFPISSFGKEWSHGIIETREMNVALIFFVLSIWFFQYSKSTKVVD